MSVSSFGTLGVPDDLCARLTTTGIVDPFPIQSAVIPDALAGRDVTGRAPTGSGKTLAFGIPLVANLQRGSRRRPTALVLAPTRELAEQIATELRPLAKIRRHSVVSVYGGVGYGPQRKGLDAGASLVVGCPGRLEDLLTMGALRLDDVKQVVIDEADRLADMGFMPAVQRILEQVHPDRQVLMFSATLDGAVGKLATSVQRDPVRHEVGPPGPDMNNARHAYWTVDRADRSDLTADIVRQFGSTMVFCRTRHGADRVAKRLSQLGVSAAPLHGGLTQPKRDKALKSFSDGHVDALVATDVAARGVHVDDVAAVVHFDPPADSAAYVHRSGRTARAGASGVVIALVERGGEKSARRLQRDVGIDVAVTQPSFGSLKPAGSTPAASRPTPTTGSRRTGTVKFFHDGRGYGFIDVGGDSDVFVHYSNTRDRLATGQQVELDVRHGQKGLEGFDVVAVQGQVPVG
jgi:superfamily II DNA/RNA helicase/cold shock CspA family protein